MTWLLVTDEAPFSGGLAALEATGEPVTAVVVGSRETADRVASSGVGTVLWAESTGAIEAAGPAVAAAATAAQPPVVIASSAPGARSLASGIAAALDAVIIPDATSIAPSAGGVTVERLALRGRVIETVESAAPVVALFAGENEEPPVLDPVAVETLDGKRAEITVDAVEGGSARASLGSADHVVSVGRGVAKKDDLALIEQLAAALDAQIGCTMPVADDLGWIEKDHYIGRSGQQISPRLYLAVGISGAPQHMEGVRGAKVVAAINSDPDARVFRTADYGIVGDLYDVVPALITQLTK